MLTSEIDVQQNKIKAYASYDLLNVFTAESSEQRIDTRQYGRQGTCKRLIAVSTAQIGTISVGFGEFEFLGSGELRRHGVRLKVSGQSLQVLELLFPFPDSWPPAKSCSKSYGQLAPSGTSSTDSTPRSIDCANCWATRQQNRR